MSSEEHTCIQTVRVFLELTPRSWQWIRLKHVCLHRQKVWSLTHFLFFVQVLKNLMMNLRVNNWTFNGNDMFFIHYLCCSRNHIWTVKKWIEKLRQWSFPDDKSDVSPSLRERYDVISNSANNLKLYRHPGIVKFLEHIPGSRTNQGGYLITEKTSPLTVVLSQVWSLIINFYVFAFSQLIWWVMCVLAPMRLHLTECPCFSVVSGVTPEARLMSVKVALTQRIKKPFRWNCVIH